MDKEKIDKRVLKTKRNIRQSFMVLLEKKDFHKITVSELARHALIDRKTFYLHYQNTSELLKEFENDMLEHVLRDIVSMKVFDVHETLKVFNAILNENKVFFEAISRTGKNTFFLKRCEDIIIQLLQTQFKESAKENCLIYHFKYIASGTISAYMEWLSDEKRMDLQSLSDIISELLKTNLTAVEKFAGFDLKNDNISS